MSVRERIPYVDLTEQEQEELHNWCTLHDIDYTTVPIEARIERDAGTGDWLVETFDQRNGSPYLDKAEKVVRVTLRRPFRAEIPWPTRFVRPPTEEDEIREAERKRLTELELENANLRSVVRAIRHEVDFFRHVAEDPDVPQDKAEGLKQWCELLQAALDGAPYAGGER